MKQACGAIRQFLYEQLGLAWLLSHRIICSLLCSWPLQSSSLDLRLQISSCKISIRSGVQSLDSKSCNDVAKHACAPQLHVHTPIVSMQAVAVRHSMPDPGKGFCQLHGCLQLLCKVRLHMCTWHSEQKQGLQMQADPMARTTGHQQQPSLQGC